MKIHWISVYLLQRKPLTHKEGMWYGNNSRREDHIITTALKKLHHRPVFSPGKRYQTSRRLSNGGAKSALPMV